ncbi:MAG TPA: hypothetical protein VHC47_13170 [Mucilaginibacter sp.]|nr:hypothetical protein [Mucilaginibacter sp.]
MSGIIEKNNRVNDLRTSLLVILIGTPLFTFLLFVAIGLVRDILRIFI